MEPTTLQVRRSKPNRGGSTLNKEESNALSQQLNNKRIAGNTITNFIDDMNTSNEESIDQGHPPSWVLEMTARKLAEKAVLTGNKNWLDVIGKVDTYGGGNYAQTQKGRKIIQDSIDKIDREANSREDREYIKRTRDRADDKLDFEKRLGVLFNMDEGEERDQEMNDLKQEAFNRGWSDIYNKVQNNWGLITTRQGAPTVMDDKGILNEVHSFLNGPNGYSDDYDLMRGSVTTYLAEKGIKVGESQQSKIDSLLKVFTPLSKLKDFKLVEDNIKQFGDDLIKKLTHNSKYTPPEVISEMGTQKTFLMRKLRGTLSKFMNDMQEETGKYSPPSAWDAKKREELFDALRLDTQTFLDGEFTRGITSKFIEFKPPEKPAPHLDDYNIASARFRQLRLEKFQGTISPESLEEYINLGEKIRIMWPEQWKEYEKAERDLRKPYTPLVSFAPIGKEKGKPVVSKDTQEIRNILTQNAFQSPKYIESKVLGFLSSVGKKLDDSARAEVDLFKSGVVPIDKIPSTKESLDVFDSIVGNIFPGYQLGLLNLASMDITKKIPGVPIAAIFQIRDAVSDIKKHVELAMGKAIKDNGDKPYDLWSLKQKNEFNRRVNNEIKEKFLNWKQGAKKDKSAEIIKNLKAISADTGDDADKEKAAAEQDRAALLTLIDKSDIDLNFDDPNDGRVGAALKATVDTLTAEGNKEKLQRLFTAVRPLEKMPKDITLIAKGIKLFLLAYYSKHRK